MRNGLDIIESLFGIKVSRTAKFIFNFCILLFVVLGWYFLPRFSEYQNEVIRKKWKEYEFSGRINDIKNDHSNHGATIIILKNGEKIGNLSGSYSYQIKKNDSIFKLKFNDTIYIKRGEKLIKIE